MKLWPVHEAGLAGVALDGRWFDAAFVVVEVLVLA
jgi:hypothetical protein